MGKNKLKKFAEMANLPNVIQPSFDEVFRVDHPLKSQWNSLYFKNQQPIVLELGCGKGEYTVGLAERFPEKNFIGVDIKGARMHTGAQEAYQKKLANAAFLRTRIEFISSMFGRNEVDEIWLTFPDPQMKKTNKRLTSAHFLTRYASFLKSGAIIHLKTDSQFLYAYTRELIRINGFEILADQIDLYHMGYQDEILSLKTHYETQWLAKGIAIKYLKFKPAFDQELLEPQEDFDFDSYHSKGGNCRERILVKGQRTKGR